jgi:hypothetical protein
MTVLDCEYNDEFGGILAKLLIDGNIFWLGQQLDATDKKTYSRLALIAGNFSTAKWPAL